jgi:hypothetical protein
VPKKNPKLSAYQAPWTELFLHNTKEALKLRQTAAPTQQNRDLLEKLRAA